MEISPYFKLLSSDLIVSFKELSLIRPSFPPKFELSEILCMSAALSKFSLLISSIISVYFFFKLFLFLILNKISDNKKFFFFLENFFLFSFFTFFGSILILF